MADEKPTKELVRDAMLAVRRLALIHKQMLDSQTGDFDFEQTEWIIDSMHTIESLTAEYVDLIEIEACK